VPRHPSGSVRAAGAFGMLRWEGLAWHREPPVRAWIDAVTACGSASNADVLTAMPEFAVHDLGRSESARCSSSGPTANRDPPVEERLSIPPPLEIRTAIHLAPLRHALAQIGGAAVFDGQGVLRQLGVRVVPSTTAEEIVNPLGGTRHTSARHYSYDDPSATVIVVSEDGPVSVLREGLVLGRSPHD
jgi:hypothetical protein